jgi:hypothetical protein
MLLNEDDEAAAMRNVHALVDEYRKNCLWFLRKEVGKCVLDSSGALFTQDVGHLVSALRSSSLRFHEGSLHGAWPQLR